MIFGISYNINITAFLKFLGVCNHCGVSEYTVDASKVSHTLVEDCLLGKCLWFLDEKRITEMSQ